MTKWSLRPDPSPLDPARHVLLIKGEMKHVSQIVKKFGAMCGRPLKADHAEGFNVSIYLHGITKTGVDKVARFLGEIAPAAQGDVASAIPAATLPGGTPLPDIPPMVREVPRVPTEELFSGMQAPAVRESVRPAPAEPPIPQAPPATPPATMPDAEPEEAGPVLLPPSLVTPAIPPPAPVIPVPAPVIPVPAPVIPPPAPVVPPPAPVVPPPAPVVASAAPAIALVAPKPLWGLHVRPEPKLTFDSLLVGAYNRFAHAAATSVVGSPGTMYNPLFIYGSPGVGKTHLLNAIGAALRKNWDEASVMTTTGACLASAVSLALAEGRYAEIEKAVAGAKALLVDDMHLLAITEKNQATLAKLFGEFFSRNLQVVLTSVYPPRTLGALEEALKISLAKGWAVDMKVPNPTIQEDMINAFVERRAAGLAGADIKKLMERMGTGYSEFPRLVLRWGALSELYRLKGATPGADEIVGDLLSAGARNSQADLPNPSELEASRHFAPPAPAPDAVNLALFCPRGQDAMVTWLVERFYKVGAEFRAPQTYRHVLCESYDAEQPLGVPFQIGESCQRSGAQAALVLGPPREARLAAREGEFAHAVRHILESFGLAAGWVPFTETTTTRPFLAAHLDFKVFFKK
jgi:chromosomal replication initiator protein